MVRLLSSFLPPPAPLVPRASLSPSRSLFLDSLLPAPFQTAHQVLHDPSDVLLEGAKLASYAGFERGSALLFALLACSWAALRLWLLPLRVMRSVAVDAPRVLGRAPIGSRQLNAALLVLWILHCYWFALIVRVAWLRVTSGRLRDAREETEEEERGRTRSRSRSRKARK